jgi:hypothetical protein
LAQMGILLRYINKLRPPNVLTHAHLILLHVKLQTRSSAHNTQKHYCKNRCQEPPHERSSSQSQTPPDSIKTPTAQAHSTCTSLANPRKATQYNRSP